MTERFPPLNRASATDSDTQTSVAEVPESTWNPVSATFEAISEGVAATTNTRESSATRYFMKGDTIRDPFRETNEMRRTSFANQGPDKEGEVRRALGHPSGEIRVPGLAVWDVHAHVVAQRHKFDLAVSAHAIKHLKFPRR